jgi:hypothetical protein
MKKYSEQCATCKYFGQGLLSSFCEHEKATEDQKNYRYYIDSCDRHETGTSESRKDYMANQEEWDKKAREALAI